MLRKLVPLIVAACITMPASAADMARVGQLLGHYITSVDIAEKYANSVCGHLLKKSYSTKAAIQEALSILPTSPRQAMASYINSADFRNQMSQNVDLVNGAVDAAKRDGMTTDAACGFVGGMVGVVVKKGELSFEQAKNVLKN